MGKILYIGNNLRDNKTNISSIRTLGPLLETVGYTVYYTSHFKNKFFRLLHMVYSLLTINRSVDYVLIDTYSTLNFYYALITSQITRILNIPYITNLNGGNLPHRLDKSPKLSRLIFKNAYKNVAPSKYLQKSFEDHGYLNTIHIPNTIEIKNYPYRERDFDMIRLLWVRSFSKIYNPQLAIKILKQLQDKGIKASLSMVGPDSDGSYKDVKNLAKNLNVEVDFTGKLSKEDWIKLSEEHNIFINTTNFDNTPISVIEAMALGLPVISTNVGGMPYLIDHNENGILVAPDDVSSFVDAILWVLNNKLEVRNMTIKARKKVEDYDWEQVKTQWLEVLK